MKPFGLEMRRLEAKAQHGSAPATLALCFFRRWFNHTFNIDCKCYDELISIHRQSEIRSSRWRPSQVRSSCDLIDEYRLISIVINRVHLIASLSHCRNILRPARTAACMASIERIIILLQSYSIGASAMQLLASSSSSCS